VPHHYFYYFFSFSFSIFHFSFIFSFLSPIFSFLSSVLIPPQILLVKNINLKFENQNLILLLFSLEFYQKMKIQEQIPFLFHFSTPLATPKPTTHNKFTTHNQQQIYQTQSN
jgi:hypothetical protein